MKRQTKRREAAAAPAAGRPPRGAYRNGIDLTQIRYMLSLTPAERLQVLQSSAASLAELRAAATKV